MSNFHEDLMPSNHMPVRGLDCFEDAVFFKEVRAQRLRRELQARARDDAKTVSRELLSVYGQILTRGDTTDPIWIELQGTEQTVERLITQDFLARGLDPNDYSQRAQYVESIYQLNGASA